jgi:hypothetical protein
MGFGLIIGFMDSLIQHVPTLYNSLLHTCARVHAYTRTHKHTHTSVYSHVFTNRCLVVSSNGMFPFLWIPELSPATATSFSQQQLTMTEPQ